VAESGNGIAERLTASRARGKAEECRAMAKVAVEKPHRIMLESIAQTWDRIAETVNEEH
jgi:hypothetical protein